MTEWEEDAMDWHAAADQAAADAECGRLAAEEEGQSPEFEGDWRFGGSGLEPDEGAGCHSGRAHRRRGDPMALDPGAPHALAIFEDQAEQADAVHLELQLMAWSEEAEEHDFSRAEDEEQEDHADPGDVSDSSTFMQLPLVIVVDDSGDEGPRSAAPVSPLAVEGDPFDEFFAPTFGSLAFCVLA